ncbi:MAG: glycosyl hydrolase [Epsilonproteobacteria bacterium]|nr:glycosyl hydrolase [Campylobacterota bacterium]
MKPPFSWDIYSDQAALLKDKDYKKSMRKKELFSLIKTYLVSLVILPIAWLAMPFAKRKPVMSKEFFTLGVDFERESQATLAMLDDLGVQSILVRLGLWEMEKLPKLKRFIEQNSNRHITLKIMQDREHIEDKELLRQDLRKIFESLHVDIYEVGTTINRTKWGFFSVNEYLEFYKVAYTLKKEHFPEIQLIGSGVIDFEFHFTAHTLFNFCRCRYDGIAALLYVDRRGAPENTQLGHSLQDKIALLSSLVAMSPKTKKRIYITETNYPIKDTAPYAPTSQKECVNEEDYTNFMVRYYLLAFASAQVDMVSWHQLIAKGYGLVSYDFEEKKLHKRKAYDAYKTILTHLQGAKFLRMDVKRLHYRIMCIKDNKLLEIHWSLVEKEFDFSDGYDIYDIYGAKIASGVLHVNEAPYYIYDTKAEVV